MEDKKISLPVACGVLVGMLEKAYELTGVQKIQDAVSNFTTTGNIRYLLKAFEYYQASLINMGNYKRAYWLMDYAIPAISELPIDLPIIKHAPVMLHAAQTHLLMDEETDFKDKLKILLVLNDLKQSSLADLAQVPQQTISAIMGGRSPRQETKEKLSNAIPFLGLVLNVKS